MAFLAESSPESIDASVHGAIQSGRSNDRRMADALRLLAMDALSVAHAGETDTPLNMADALSLLWTRFLKFDAADPHWADRDRFVLSTGHGSALLYGLLHLTGHNGVPLDSLKRFRSRGAPIASHPEFGAHPAIEATTGPAGLGLAQAVGMALAERVLAARFGRSLVDHRVWVLGSAGELMEGISHEAAGLAGQLRLEKLTLIYEEPAAEEEPGEEGPCAAPEDTLRRFAAQGWAVQRADAQDIQDIAAALSFATRAKKPTVIALRSLLGLGMRGLAPSEIRAQLGWTFPPFCIPNALVTQWNAAGARGAVPRRAWLKRIARHPSRAEFERVISGRLPDTLHETFAQIKSAIASERPRLATGRASLKMVEALACGLPELVTGAVGGDGVQKPPLGMAAIGAGNFNGRFVRYGVREHAMAATMNGMALHGGVIPSGSSQLAFSDYLRPALRLACLMRQRMVHVMTHDGLGVVEDGPTHRAVEQLAALRAMPGLHVFRPADAMEIAEAWDLALRRTDGPSVVVVGHQMRPALRTDHAENRLLRGGYVLAEAEGARAATLIATGSEVATAMAARALLSEEGISTAVVSLPCWELFAQADAAYRRNVLGGAPRFGIEAAGGFGWERWLGEDGFFIGFSGFGPSSPCKDLFEHYGMTPEAIAAVVRKRIFGIGALVG